jgi:curved DNA-binding protein CbpA
MIPRNEDPYAVLGVEPEATAAVITRAFHTLLRRHHPDASDDAPTARDDTPAAREPAPTIGQVVAAYAVLHDPTRRAEYDETRRRTSRAQHAGAADTGSATKPADTATAGGPTSAAGGTTTRMPAGRRHRGPVTVAGPVVVLGELGPRARRALGRL